MAHFRMHTQIKHQTIAFAKGFYSVLSRDFLSLFSVPEVCTCATLTVFPFVQLVGHHLLLVSAATTRIRRRRTFEFRTTAPTYPILWRFSRFTQGYRLVVGHFEERLQRRGTCSLPQGNFIVQIIFEHIDCILN